MASNTSRSSRGRALGRAIGSSIRRNSGSSATLSCSMSSGFELQGRKVMGAPNEISRRHMLAMSAAGGLAAATWTRAQAPAAKRIDQFDPALEKIISTTEPIKDIAFGFGGPLGSAEGPVWIREGG